MEGLLFALECFVRLSRGIFYVVATTVKVIVICIPPPFL
jgi:hypothetical protein